MDKATKTAIPPRHVCTEEEGLVFFFTSRRGTVHIFFIVQLYIITD